MGTVSTFPACGDLLPLDVRLDGPDGEAVHDADLRRLFPGSTLTQARLDRLRSWPRVFVTLAGQLVAVATCQKTDGELRVPDVGIEVPPAGPRCSERDILNAVLDAVEVACIAGGCRRLVVNPPCASLGFLERRGYVRVNERCAGGWIEKTIA
jgi:hypothetical protein